MGPSRRHTRSAGISSGTGVQKWTRPVNSLPYPTLLFAQLAICFHHDHLHPRGVENENLDLVERLNIIGDARRMDVHGGCQNKRFFTLSQIKSIPCSLSICYWNWVGFRPSPTWSLGDRAVLGPRIVLLLRVGYMAMIIMPPASAELFYRNKHRN